MNSETISVQTIAIRFAVWLWRDLISNPTSYPTSDPISDLISQTPDKQSMRLIQSVKRKLSSALSK